MSQHSRRAQMTAGPDGTVRTWTAQPGPFLRQYREELERLQARVDQLEHAIRTALAALLDPPVPGSSRLQDELFAVNILRLALDHGPAEEGDQFSQPDTFPNSGGTTP